MLTHNASLMRFPPSPYLFLMCVCHFCTEHSSTHVDFSFVICWCCFNRFLVHFNQCHVIMPVASQNTICKSWAQFKHGKFCCRRRFMNTTKTNLFLFMFFQTCRYKATAPIQSALNSICFYRREKNSYYNWINIKKFVEFSKCVK